MRDSCGSSSNESTRLGIMVEQPAVFFNNRYYTSDQFLDELSFLPDFDEIHLFIPVKQDNNQHDLFEIGKNIGKTITVHPLPYFASSLNFYNNFISNVLSCFRIIYSRAKDWDVSLIFDYHLTSLIFFIVSKMKRKRVISYFRSDLLEEVAAFYNKNGWKAISAQFGARILDILSLMRSRYSFNIVMGSRLRKKFAGHSKHVYTFYPTHIKNEDLRLHSPIDLNQEAGNLVLLFVGRLTPEKGLGFLIEALSILSVRYPGRFSLNIVGTGRQEAELREQVRALGLQECVHFIGPINSKQELFIAYSNADIFVLPSLTEGAPKVLSEAMLFGLPIVSTTVGGIPDLVSHEQNGILVSPRNSNALADAVCRIGNNEILRRNFSRASRSRVRELTFEVQQAKIIPLLRSFLGME